MCCGSKRAAARDAALAVPSRPKAAVTGPPDPQGSVFVFEYIGASPIAIRGPVSGRVYRFAHAGDRIRVDARDRPGLAASKSLRWIR